jgi:DNA processing protein
MAKAGKEIEFILKNKINVYFYTEKEYPQRLKTCADAPIILYTKGNMNLDGQRVISIVGTRNATDYGKHACDELVRKIAERKYQILITSGLAYGIDIHAHKAALKYNLPTAAVVAHGLDRIYPSLHREIAFKMLACGGLVTDFPSETKIDPQNFLRRNRIIAGLADATIVVESAEKGGALVTADIASSYNRDVFAFPGRAGDNFSKGCNQLIRNSGASLIEGIDDLEFFMGWENKSGEKAVQAKLFVDLLPDEEKVVKLLNENGELFIDNISSELSIPVNRISSLLMNMEFKNILIALPGKKYRLV